MQRRLCSIWPFGTALAIAVCVLAGLTDTLIAQPYYSQANPAVPNPAVPNPAVPNPAVNYGANPYPHGIVPGAPQHPQVISRGDSWPGSPMPMRQQMPHAHQPPPSGPQPARRPPWSQPRPQTQPRPPAMVEIEGAQIAARVGSESILYNDVLPGISRLKAANRGKVSEEQLEAEIKKLLQKQLPQHIETKLVFYDAKRTIPAENFPNVEKSLAKQFEKVELKQLIERYKAGSRRELEEKMREMGTSLERQKRAFVQRTLAQQWIRQQVNFEGEITYDQMLAHYYDHLKDFDNPARARWEQLMVRFSRYPDKATARAAISRMGNQVLGGVPFGEVARQNSHGSTAEDGGARDWTTSGSLVCEQLDRALFGLPLHQLSPILEGPNGLHIIRVIEREAAGRTSFIDAQVEIRNQIRRQRTQRELREYVQRLKEEIPVWTIFDEDDTSGQISGRRSLPRR